MWHYPGVVLSACIGVIEVVGATSGVDVPLPIEISLLGLVALVLRWLIRKDNQTDTATLERVESLEEAVVKLQLSESQQRHLKHESLNRAIALETALTLLHRFASTCTCGVLDPVLPLLDEIVRPASSPVSTGVEGLATEGGAS